MDKNNLSRRNFLMMSALASAGVASSGIFEFTRARAAADKPLRAAMSNAGLAASWCAQGKSAAESIAKQLNVTIEWFDGELDPSKQRAKFDQIATQKWDFVAVQPNSIGTLKEP